MRSRSFHRIDTSILAVAALVAGACGRPAVPAMGVSTGRGFLNAARMALAERSESLRLDTLLVPESDSRSAPAIRTARRFVAEPGMIAVIGHSNSGASLAASQIYNESRVVQIAPTTSAEVYSKAGPFSFRLVPPDDRQAAFLAAQVKRLLPLGGRLAILYVNDDYGRGLHAALLAALDTTTYRITARLPHLDRAADSAVIARTVTTLREARPDLIVWLGRTGPLSRYLPVVHSRLGRIPVLGSDAVAPIRHSDNRDGRWDDVFFPATVDLESTPQLRAFRRRYRERFQQEPSGADALTYDAVALVLAGIEAGARTGPELRSYLQSLGRERPAFPGLTGPISFDAQGDRDRDYFLLSVDWVSR